MPKNGNACHSYHVVSFSLHEELFSVRLKSNAAILLTFSVFIQLRTFYKGVFYGLIVSPSSHAMCCTNAAKHSP